MNLEKLVKFEVRRDLENWRELSRILKSKEYFSEYEKKEKPIMLAFGRFLRQYGVKKIIDSHTHSFTYEHFREPRPVESTIYPAMPVTSIPNAPIELMMWVCNEVYNKGAGVPFELATFGLCTYHMDARAENAYVLARSKKYSPRVHPFALVPPSFQREALELLAKQGFRGFKPYYLLMELDIQGGTDSGISDFSRKYNDLSLSQWLTEDIVAVAEEKNLPIIVHLAPTTNKKMRETYDEFDRILKNHPNAKFILAHLGICHTPEDFRQYVGRYCKRENVFIETSNIQNPEVLECAFTCFDGRQLLYGSDLPFSLVRAGVVTVTPAIVSNIEDEDIRAMYSKALGKPLPLTKGRYLYTENQNLQAFQKAMPDRTVSAYKLAMVEQLVAIQAACENLVAKKEFTPKEMSGFLQAFFHGNAQRLLNI